MRKSEIIEILEKLYKQVNLPSMNNSGLQDYIEINIHRLESNFDRRLASLEKRLISLEKYLQVDYKRDSLVMYGVESVSNERHEAIEYCKKCNQEIKS